MVLHKYRVVLAIIVLGLVIMGGCAQKESAWSDGTYRARTDPDSHNWYAQNEITITDGRITEVKYQEINAESGQPKGDDYRYPQAIEAQRTLEKQLLDTQDPDKVDIVSGATQPSQRFKETAKEALKQAK